MVAAHQQGYFAGYWWLVRILVAATTAAFIGSACTEEESVEEIDCFAPMGGEGSVFDWKSRKDTEGTSAFWAAMRAGRYEDIPQVIELLEAELSTESDPSWVAHIRWRVSVWQLAEMSRLVEPLPEPEVYSLVLESMSLLESSWALNPDDDRYFCFQGALQLSMAREMQDEELAAESIAAVETMLDLVPWYANDCLLLAYSDEDVGSDTFNQAVAAVWSSAEDNLGMELDRSNPDVSGLIEPDMVEAWEGCMSFSYIWEGLWLRAGDVLLKSGDLEAARSFYQNGTLRNYEAWPLYPIFDERIAGLSERSALYTDSDPNNDPRIGEPAWNCGMCHRE